MVNATRVPLLQECIHPHHLVRLPLSAQSHYPDTELSIAELEYWRDRTTRLNGQGVLR
jgi:hypothetical protein